MPNITEIDSYTSSEVQLYSQIFCALDYIPVVSSGKCLADLFFAHCWDPPESLAELSSFSFAYYQTLNNKSEFRYIAFVPIVGNIVLILSDAYDAFNAMQIDGNIDNARSGDIEAIRSLLTGNTAQKTVGIESGCGIESLKWTLCSAFAEEDSSAKAEIVNTLKRSADNGNRDAYRFLAGVLMEYYATGPDLGREIYVWILDKCKDLNWPCHELAWETLKTRYEYYRDRDSIIPVYLELVKNPRLSRDKADYLADKLARLLTDGSIAAPLRLQIFNAFRQMADQGHAVFMYHVGRFFLRQGNVDQAKIYLETAARADHLPSILALAQFYQNIMNDLERAIFWYEKAERLDPSVSPILSRLRVELLFERQRAQHQAGAQQAQDQEAARRRQAAEEARQRAEEEEAARERQEAAQRAAARGTVEQQLRRIFGTGFTTSQELSAAFREWSRRNHPDRGGNVETFQRVNHLVGIIRESQGWR